MKKEKFISGRYFHIFNRGVDKRNIFSDKYDVFRFIQSLEEFNRVDSGNDLFYTNKSKKNKKVGHRKAHQNDKKLVDIICYCLNLNHYHFILREVSEGGVSEFMKRLGGGYTQAFNLRYKRSGVLFQGRFKAVCIESNKQLLYVSVYVNLNNKVHKKFDGSKKIFLDLIQTKSSWNEYVNKNVNGMCKKDIILDQFDSIEDYKKFAEETIEVVKEKRYEE